MTATTRYDVAVIGGGPAGIAAAVTAAENRCKVVLVDESPRLGGQIWRERQGKKHSAARPWIRRLDQAGVTILPGTSVVRAEPPGEFLTTQGKISSRKAILACGAREKFLPFPGWTQAGVLGVGGVQALVHSGLDVSNRRIVIAGTGPLLPQVAWQLKRHGARVLRIAEQTPFSKLRRFSTLLGFRKIVQAFTLADYRFRTSTWPLEVLGENRVEAVTLQRGRITESFDVDYLAVGFGLTPNLEVPLAMGCRVHENAVWVDDRQFTSAEGVLAAGEGCGIKGVWGALADGTCAGYAVAGLSPPPRLLQRRNRERRFGVRLAEAFELRPEIKTLAQPSTTICRCENVALEAVVSGSDWNSTKLKTRCGMGLCQGRICGDTTRTLWGWGPTGVRPPLVPTPIQTLLSTTFIEGPES